jgi:hypothetical protein
LHPFERSRPGIALGNGNGDVVKIGLLGLFFSSEVHTDASVTLGNGIGDEVLASDTNNSTITVGNGDNDIVRMILGIGPNNFQSDNPHNDIITVGNGNNDTVFGGGHDTITTGNGNNDIVFSGGQNSLLSLFAGSIITVGNGNDIIHVGLNDTVTVGKGHDAFVFDGFFQSAPGGIGAVTIDGFNTSKDVIVVQGALATSYTAQDNSNGNAVVTFAGDASDQITLVGVHSSALHGSDFHFV